MAKPRKLKAYIAHNLDGRRMAMVAAMTMKDAARAMRTTEGQMRSFGWSLAKGDDEAKALSMPGRVFYASLNRIARPREWSVSTAA